MQKKPWYLEVITSLQTRDATKIACADFHSALIPHTSHIEEDGLLITGQNPLSTGPTAKALIKALERS